MRQSKEMKEETLKYKELWQVEQVFRDMKSVLDTRPIFHYSPIILPFHRLLVHDITPQRGGCDRVVDPIHKRNIVAPLEERWRQA
ncbi:MAG: hypothetical protein ACYC6Q_04950 [Syntrophales bacterium]